MNGMWIGSFPLEPHRSPKNIPAFCRRKCSVYCVLSESNACLTTKPNWSDIIRISHADSDSTVPWEEQKGLRLVAWSWIVLRLLIHSHHTQLASSLGYNGWEIFPLEQDKEGEMEHGVAKDRNKRTTTACLGRVEKRGRKKTQDGRRTVHGLLRWQSRNKPTGEVEEVGGGRRRWSEWLAFMDSRCAAVEFWQGPIAPESRTGWVALGWERGQHTAALQLIKH